MITAPMDVERVKGAEWQAWSKSKKRRFLLRAVRYWRRKGFPYYALTKDQIAHELELLIRYDAERCVRGRTIIASMVGLRLANYFHPQMWHVRCTRYDSPYETFKVDAKLTAAIEKALTIWPDRYGASASSLRRILRSFSNTVGVHNFRPTVAKAIVNRFTPENGTIIDFSAGYGGRLLGALVLNRNYVGIDPSKEQVGGLRKMISECKDHLDYIRSATILCGPAEHLLSQLPPKEADLVFSSPPYFNVERYRPRTNQSYFLYRTLSQWLEQFLGPVTMQAARVLKRGGHLVINIANRPYPLSNWVKNNAPPSLRLVCEYKMKLSRFPFKRSARSTPFKSEPILVFRRT